MSVVAYVGVSHIIETTGSFMILAGSCHGRSCWFKKISMLLGFGAGTVMVGLVG